MLVETDVNQFPRGRLCALTLLVGITIGCGSAASQQRSQVLLTGTPLASISLIPECSAPMDPASPSLAGSTPTWITFDRSHLGPHNTARVSADPIGILIVVGDEIPFIRFHLLDARGGRMALSPQTGAGPLFEMDLRQAGAFDRGNVWQTRIAVRFIEPGCYHGVFEGLRSGPRKVQIRIDP